MLGKEHFIELLVASAANAAGAATDCMFKALPAHISLYHYEYHFASGMASGRKQLLAFQPIIGDQSLAPFGYQPFGKGFGQIDFHVRVLFGINGNHTVRIGQACIAFDQNVQFQRGLLTIFVFDKGASVAKGCRPVFLRQPSTSCPCPGRWTCTSRPWARCT